MSGCFSPVLETLTFYRKEVCGFHIKEQSCSCLSCLSSLKKYQIQVFSSKETTFSLQNTSKVPPKVTPKVLQAVPGIGIQSQVTLKNTSGSYFRVCVAPVFCMYPLRTFNFMLFIPPSIAAQLMVDCTDAASPPQLTLKAHVLPQRTYWWSIQCTVWLYSIHASTLTKYNICNLWPSCRLWLLSSLLSTWELPGLSFHQVQVEFPTVHKHA